jgi:hypothetical protein
MPAIFCLLFSAFAFLNCGFAEGKNGVDLSVATTSEQWACLVNTYDVTYGIIRAYRSSGQLDLNGPDSIILASDAGVKSIGAYIFPCISSSAYSVNNDIQCVSAEQQVDQTVKNLISHGIAIDENGVTPPLFKAAVNRVWLDIEDESPSKYFDSNVTVNLQFLEAMVAELNRRAIPVGIYTTKTYWQNIMNNTLGYSQFPLWYPR